MTVLDDILAHNARFVADRNRPLTKAPAKKVAIFTCMDTRLVEFLEPAMGLRRGDAMVIKNAGTTVIDPTGGVIRSLVVAVHALGCAEIYVIGHLDCWMAQVDEATLERRMLESGVPQAAIDGLHPNLSEWLGNFRDVYGNVRRVTAIIRENPLIPRDVPVHGLMFDPASGSLELLERGHEG
ncbi:MAG: carbonic anhydrase [Dehalococcoidia bacterium]|nr:carbonic anhydrase [Dehalococcoidia bacterium]